MNFKQKPTKMKTKHTQGEWKITSIEVSEDNSFPYSIITGYDSERVCIVDKDGSNTYEAYEANAKLIRSAPDMLKSLQDSQFAIETFIEICQLENIKYEHANVVLTSIKEAIKKATE